MPPSARTSHDSASAPPQPFDAFARRDYYRFQFCIWGFFWVIGILGLIWDTSPSELKPWLAALKTFEIAVIGFCSHAIWLIGRRRDWLRKPERARRRGLIACLAGAAVATALALPFNLMIYNTHAHPHMAQYSFPLLVIGHWVGVTIGLAIWGGLYSSYYYQTENRRLETERARLLAATREAQLMALKGQINPHFLFNSLNTLRALIQHEPAMARDAVTHLAEMMRYSLTMSGHPVIPLAAELDFVNDYLALERLRHEDRLRIHKSITPEALRENIPPMLLQTLVENAVKHGLNQSSRGILVTCDISMTPQESSAPGEPACLRLRVTNQGRLEPASGENGIFAGGKALATTGTGLRNARERLRLLYGAHAALAVSQQDDLVVAEAVIPLAAIPRTASMGTSSGHVARGDGEPAETFRTTTTP